MYPVFETIRIEDGVVQRLPYHLQRMQRTANSLWAGHLDKAAIEAEVMMRAVNAPSGRQRLRIDYGPSGRTMQLSPYRIKPLRTLHLHRADTLRYSSKFSERRALEESALSLPEDEDILFVQGDLLSDTVYGNVLLWDGLQWHTPSTPLLLGTHRQALLDEGRAAEAEIRIGDLPCFERISILSAMLDPGEREIPVSDILPLGSLTELP